MSRLTLQQLATEIISAHPRPVITRYEFGVSLYLAIRGGAYAGRRLLMTSTTPTRRHYTGALNFLDEHGILRPIRGLRQAYTTLSADKDTSVEEMVCRADPFCYLSHLSAMQFHGLTDRITQTVFVSSPSIKDWPTFANDRMQRDLAHDKDAYVEARFPALRRPKLEKVAGQPVHVSHRKHLGAYRRIKSTDVRVSTLGRTFLDMLREPDLCGGIRHVLSLYEAHAQQYLGLIVDDIDAHGSNIDKVRAGYVLSERLNLQHDTIESWRALVQRGGSRRLYAKNEYSPTYSEHWSISLNVD